MFLRMTLFPGAIGLDTRPPRVLLSVAVKNSVISFGASTQGSHPFSFRTRKLSPVVLMILLCGKVGRRQNLGLNFFVPELSQGGPDLQSPYTCSVFLFKKLSQVLQSGPNPTSPVLTRPND